MNYFDGAAAAKKKIEDALADKQLVLSIRETYPITLIISQSQAMENQMSLLSAADEDASSVDASIRFIFDMDGMKLRTHERIVITDAFLAKLIGLAKKWHTAFCHAFFAQSCLENRAKALIDEYSGDYSEEDESPDDFPEDDPSPFDEFMTEDAEE